jgi:uncharacterized protein (DUF302 family)
MSNFGFGKTVKQSFDEAIERVTDELSKEGFGVLTTIAHFGCMQPDACPPGH